MAIECYNYFYAFVAVSAASQPLFNCVSNIQVFYVQLLF